MGTRCSITIRDRYGKEYRIYRHCDGYPEGVLSDLQTLMRVYDGSPVESPERFLADFIFYATLDWWMRRYNKKRRNKKQGSQLAPFDYGVCSPDCEHGDLEYEYLIYPKDGKVMLRIVQVPYKIIFNGEIESAFERWAVDGGCHVNPKLLLLE